jgi:hypothetical protein
VFRAARKAASPRSDEPHAIAASSRINSSHVAVGTGSGAKLTVKRTQGLRAAVGKKLGLGIVRSATAPASGATLSLRFH